MLFACGCSDKRFTFDTLMKVHDHQTYAQVVDILGKPDRVEMAPVGNVGKLWVDARWGIPPAKQTIDVRFEDGEVSQIWAFGIEAPK
jgi:hypothetical protein